MHLLLTNVNHESSLTCAAVNDIAKLSHKVMHLTARASLAASLQHLVLAVMMHLEGNLERR